MNSKVIIYSTPTCPYCKQAKEYLLQKGIEYTDIDISADEASQKEMMEKSGVMSVPVIDIEGTIVIGFDKEKINRALGG